MYATPKRTMDRSSLPWSEGRPNSSSKRRPELGESPRTPMTPVSARQGLWRSFNGQIVDNYSDSGSIGSVIVATPGAIAMPSCTYRNSRILKQAMKYPIPDKFKQMMPNRNEESNKADMSSDSKLKPIEQKNFYGEAKPKISPPKPMTPKKSPKKSPAKKVSVRKDLVDDSDQENDLVFKTPISEKRKSGITNASSMEFKSPIAEKQKSDVAASKKASEESSNKLAKKNVLRRVSSSGMISKRNKFSIRKKFGMNKGVQHAIRKPSFKKLKPKKVFASKRRASVEKPAKKPKREKEIKEEDLAKRIEKLLASKNPKIIKTAKKKSGKLAVAQDSPNVCYEIRNGFPVFRLRRSPRKQESPSAVAAFSSPTIVNRKTPAKLFTPSGTNDYLAGNPVAVTKRRGPGLPSPVKSVKSPVKFDVLDNTADEEAIESGQTVLGLIDSLASFGDEDEEMESPDKKNGYAVHVTDDELAKMAAQTVSELESIAHEDQQMEFVIENLPPLIHETPTKRSTRQSPLKRLTNGKDSPFKRTQTTISPTKAFSPRKSSRKAVQSPFIATKPVVNVAESIKDILANLAPPTEDEIRTKRTPKPLQEISNSPSKADKNPKMFPIFGKGFSENISSNSGKRQGSSKKKLQLASTVNEEVKSGLKQAVIDAGQKRIGVEHCLLCDFVFTVGDADEEKMHREKHDQAMGIVKFTGWKNERIVRQFDDGKVILVRPGDPKRHWTKVETVLDVVDNTLGISGRGIRQPEQSKVFLFIADGRVAGFLLAETIAKSDHVTLAFENECKVRVLEDIDPEKAKNVLVGISRIWVEPSFQRKGIATRMVDAVRAEFLPGKFLKVSEFAFTHTTPSGTDFASKYVKQTEFLAYTPAIEGEIF